MARDKKQAKVTPKQMLKKFGKNNKKGSKIGIKNVPVLRPKNKNSFREPS
jgi:hypothetical protein